MKTGGSYFRGRWYDPISGRWLSKDPIGISGGLNQYVFCGNNPVNFRDPLGLCEDRFPWDESDETFWDWLTSPDRFGTKSWGDRKDLRGHFWVSRLLGHVLGSKPAYIVGELWERKVAEQGLPSDPSDLVADRLGAYFQPLPANLDQWPEYEYPSYTYPPQAVIRAPEPWYKRFYRDYIKRW